MLEVAETGPGLGCRRNSGHDARAASRVAPPEFPDLSSCLPIPGKFPFWDSVKDCTLQDVWKAILSEQVNFTRPELMQVSLPARGLLMAMLDRDPRRRITASKALEHPWLKVGGMGMEIWGGREVAGAMERTLPHGTGGVICHHAYSSSHDALWPAWTCLYDCVSRRPVGSGGCVYPMGVSPCVCRSHVFCCPSITHTHTHTHTHTLIHTLTLTHTHTNTHTHTHTHTHTRTHTHTHELLFSFV